MESIIKDVIAFALLLASLGQLPRAIQFFAREVAKQHHRGLPSLRALNDQLSGRTRTPGR
jgi:hypothetical protein